MEIKRRTMNELRQTKDVYYVTPRTTQKETNDSILESYINYMRSEKRSSQISVKNFLIYLNANNLRITAK